MKSCIFKWVNLNRLLLYTNKLSITVKKQLK